ncbi:autotransporter domain-containing protein [Cephaloticoccus primus]|nr:autotransporter domain-containing protein [Cephaloticoccus primus]
MTNKSKGRSNATINNQGAQSLGLFRKSAFALAIAGALSGTAFAAPQDAATEADYNAHVADVAVETVTVTAPITFTGDAAATALTTGDFTLQGAASLNQPALIGALSTNPALAVASGTDVALIKNLHFTQFTAATGNGAAVNVADNVADIDGVRFSNNEATAGSGGAVFIGGDLTGSLANGTFTQNKAGAAGGAVRIDGDVKGNISGSTFQGNDAGTNGGALSIGGDVEADITGSSFVANVSGAQGGAIDVNGTFGNATTAANISGSTFQGNTAATGAGAVRFGGLVTGDITGSTFQGNIATTGDAGAVLAAAGFKGNIDSTTFDGNRAIAGDAGAVSVVGDFEGNIANGSTFKSNTAALNAGAVLVSQDFKGDIAGSSFESNNAAVHAGAVLVGRDFEGKISSDFSNNIAGVNAGAVLVGRDFKGNIEGSNFDTNRATNGAGGAVSVGNDFGVNSATGRSNIKDSSFTGNRAGTDAGAVGVTQDFFGDIDNATFENNRALLGDGGAVAIGRDFGAAGTTGQKSNIRNKSSFTKNQAGGNGGAVAVARDFFGDINDVDFAENVANGSGGAVVVFGDYTGNIIDSRFVENKATTGQGGAVGVGGDFTGNVRGSTFSGNEAGTDAGALGVAGNFTGDIDGSTFEKNKANGTGGAVAVNGNFDGNIKGSTFDGNEAVNGSGGAVRVTGTFGTATNKVSIDDSTFSNNKAGTNAGAVFFNGAIFADIKNSTFENNSATNGGAIQHQQNFNGAIQGSAFIGNKAANHGGALNGAQLVASPDISGSTFIGNQVGGAAGNFGRGGAVVLNANTNKSALKLTDNTFLNNKAITDTADVRNGVGGAIYHNSRADGTLTIESSGDSRTLFYGNTNNPANGGVVENAIHFANRDAAGNDYTVTVDVTGAGDLLLLDGVSSQAAGTAAWGDVTVNVNKAAASDGDFYLGGRSNLNDDSTWTIDGGSLLLTDVDYGSGVVGAQLNLNGATAALNVGKDATLGGNGSIKAVANGFALDGTLAPAIYENTGTKADAITNDISAADIAAIGVAKTSEYGKLTLEGDTALGANTVYEVNASLNGTDADNVTITGAGTIASGAEVAITIDPRGWTGPIDYTILSASAGLGGGQFTTLTGTGEYLFLNEELVYDSEAAPSTTHNVKLRLTRNGNMGTVGSTFNQTSTGVALQNHADANPVIGGLMGIKTAAEAQAAFDNLSGEIYSSTGTALVQNASHIRNVVNARLFESEDSDRQRGVWGNVYGYNGELKGGSNTAKVDNESFGFAVGADIPVGSSANIGLLLGYETADVEIGGGRNSKSDVDTFNIGVYSGASFGGFQVRAGLTHSIHDIDTARDINAGFISGRNNSSYDATLTQLFAELAYPVKIGESFELIPYGGLQQHWLDVDGALENGTVATLRTQDSSIDVLASDLGLRFKTASLSQSSKVFLHGGLGWKHYFDKEDGISSRRFENSVGSSADFRVRGGRLTEDLLVIDLGISAAITDSQVLGLDYKGEVSSRQKQHGGQLHWSLRF